MTINMLNKLRRRTDEHGEKFNKELENIKQSQAELKDKITEVKSKLEGINSRFDHTEEWISKLEDRVVKVTQAVHTKEKRIFKNEDSLRDLWGNIKCTNSGILEEDREKGAENLFAEIIAENFPNMGKGTDIQIQEVQRVPNKINPKRSTPTHIVIKWQKLKIKRES